MEKRLFSFTDVCGPTPGKPGTAARGRGHEPSASASGNQEGCICFDIGWEAREVGRERTTLRGLGDVSPEGIAGRCKSDLCIANQRMVRADHSALGRWRQNVVSAGHAAG